MPNNRRYLLTRLAALLLAEHFLEAAQNGLEALAAHSANCRRMCKLLITFNSLLSICGSIQTKAGLLSGLSRNSVKLILHLQLRLQRCGL